MGREPMFVDMDEEFAKARRLIISVLVFLFSAVLSYREIKYSIWAKTAEAKVARTFETIDGIGRRRVQKLAVEYTFTDAATGSRSERDDVPISWKIDSPTVTVEYLPGVADSSRLKGNDQTMRVYLFAASCLWLIVEGYNVWSMAHAAVHGKRRRR